MYTCPKCQAKLTRGKEYQYPPRLCYWYCPWCQEVYREQEGGTEGKRSIECIGSVADNKDSCIQDLNMIGFVQDGITGEKSYPDTPTFDEQGNYPLSQFEKELSSE